MSLYASHFKSVTIPYDTNFKSITHPPNATNPPPASIWLLVSPVSFYCLTKTCTKTVRTGLLNLNTVLTFSPIKKQNKLFIAIRVSSVKLMMIKIGWKCMTVLTVMAWGLHPRLLYSSASKLLLVNLWWTFVSWLIYYNNMINIIYEDTDKGSFYN